MYKRQVQGLATVRHQLTNVAEVSIDTITVVTLWVENTTVRFRVNGVNKALHASSVAMTAPMQNNPGQFMVGATQAAGGSGTGVSHFDGNIYPVMCMDRSPTEAEILAAETYIGALAGVSF